MSHSCTSYLMRCTVAYCVMTVLLFIYFEHRTLGMDNVVNMLNMFGLNVTDRPARNTMCSPPMYLNRQNTCIQNYSAICIPPGSILKRTQKTKYPLNPLPSKNMPQSWRNCTGVAESRSAPSNEMWIKSSSDHFNDIKIMNEVLNSYRKELIKSSQNISNYNQVEKWTELASPYDCHYFPLLRAYNITTIFLTLSPQPFKRSSKSGTFAYYHCTMDKNMHLLLKQPSICSANISDITNKVSLNWAVQEYSGLSTNYYHGNVTSEWGSIHGAPSMATYIHIFKDAVITSMGNIRIHNMKVIYFACFQYKLISNGETIPNKLKFVDEVFLTTHGWSDKNYYHRIVQMLPRVMMYLPFLRSNSHIHIHVPTINTLVKKIMSILGVENPLVTGYIGAKMTYSPLGSGCGLHPPSVQSMAQHFHRYIASSLLPRSALNNTRTVILVKRKERQLMNHTLISTYLQALSHRYGYTFWEFDDAHLPSLEDTMVAFHQAVLVVGPHGAGLSNLIFGQSGAVLIEVHFSLAAWTYPCFYQLSHALGMKYHGIVMTNDCLGPRCSKGLAVDMDYMRCVLNYVFEHALPQM